MIHRMLSRRLAATSKSVLLIGPRQVGKSTLAQALKPARNINLMDEQQHLTYLKDPARLGREIQSLPKPSWILVDEVQRAPVLLNTIQVLLDGGCKHRFILTGSSARKLKRGHANLLPGRVIVEHLDPLSFWELENQFELEKVLRIGALPGVYLESKSIAENLLESYSQTYLREEIQAEALTKNLGSYARFLDLAAETSGQWINYSKLSSDSEIPKETLRRFFTLLEDTLIVHRVPAFRPKASQRRVSQRERFVFFDTGVRNALLNIHRGPLGPSEKGHLFEQWVFLQIIAFSHAHRKGWKVSSFRTDTGAEVDWVVDTGSKLIAIECKLSHNVSEHDLKGLGMLSRFVSKPMARYVVYTGNTIQTFPGSEVAIPYPNFFRDILPKL